MRKLNLLLILFVFLDSAVTLAAEARGGGIGNGGISFEIGLGKPQAEIENIDGTTAYYKGLSAWARGVLPVLYGGKFSFGLVPSIKYVDLENTYSGTANETAQMLGLGLGVEMRLYGVLLGFDSHLMEVKHQSVGELSASTKYNLNINSSYFGFMKSFKQLSVGIVYAQGSGTIPKSETHLSKDSPYKENLYWLIFRYDIGISPINFIKTLF